MKIFDCDVHPMLAGGPEVVLPFVDESWRHQFTKQDFKISGRAPERYGHPGTPLRADAKPPDGGLPASDPEFVRRDLLDAWNIDVGLLLPMQGLAVAAWTDPPTAQAWSSAINRYFYETWVKLDDRFKLAITASPHDPAASAEEIASWAGTPNVIGVQLPLINTLMGNRYYYPIYEAAAAAGLPIVVHQTGAEGCYLGTPTVAGGVPRTYAERHAMLTQIGQSNVASLIFEGVFERFPDLKVIFVEYGFSWMLPLGWRLDREWKNFRMDTPWVKEPPAEYIKRHIRFATQPMDEPERIEDLWRLIEMLDGEEILCFSSDYPHYDNDDPSVILKKLPEASRERIAWSNAQEFFAV
jgi:predicted TIM-barrel fold metal-dependent hydrolase